MMCNGLLDGVMAVTDMWKNLSLVTLWGSRFLYLFVVYPAFGNKT